MTRINSNEYHFEKLEKESTCHIFTIWNLFFNYIFLQTTTSFLDSSCMLNAASTWTLNFIKSEVISLFVFTWISVFIFSTAGILPLCHLMIQDFLGKPRPFLYSAHQKTLQCKWKSTQIPAVVQFQQVQPLTKLFPTIRQNNVEIDFKCIISQSSYYIFLAFLTRSILICKFVNLHINE